MGWFISWYLTVTLLGWLTFPLAFRLFPALADRGYTLSRALGLLVWGYVFWLLTSIGITQNNIGGLLFGLLILAGLSFWALRSIDRRQQATDNNNIASGLSSIGSWVWHNRRLVINVEILFFLAFAFLAFARASNPELTSAEKPMELMFINSILRSPTFPPRLCHFLLLLWLCHDRHAGQTDRCSWHCRPQPDDSVNLWAGGDWLVWDSL